MRLARETSTERRYFRPASIEEAESRAALAAQRITAKFEQVAALYSYRRVNAMLEAFLDALIAGGAR